ncbi:hypothetical protein PTKIN_Ptkin05aG0011500 [Pterospermum kingtungense]
MACKQRPISGLSQATEAHDLYVFLIFILIVIAFSAFGISMVHETYSPRNRYLALHLDSFYVIDFRVMENQLVANWTAKFIVINKKNDVEIPIEPFDLLVFYKGTNLVSCASVAEPIILKTMYQAVVEVEFSPHGCNQVVSIDDEVVQDIEEDLRKGKIRLYLNLDLEPRYKGSIRGYGVGLEPGCALDLEFNFTTLSAERFSGNLAKKCQIPLPA